MASRTNSANIWPPVAQMFEAILPSWMPIPATTAAIVFAMSSSSIEAVGMVNLSLAEFERSRSCHSGTFSRDTWTWARSSLESDVTRSLFMGLRFTGTALLPICPLANLSDTSAISVLCRFLTSVAILSSVDPASARQKTYSACLSRGTTWVAASAGDSPSSAAASDWTRGAAAPISEPVPTTPSVLHTSDLLPIWAILSTCAAHSVAQFANRSPNGTMLACCPCVLPTAGTAAYLSAMSASASPRREILPVMTASASRICIDVAVSTRSALVSP